MELKLRDPIVFLDLETTGVDPAKTESWRFRW